MPKYDLDTVIEQAKEYKRKCNILRQIHSGKLENSTLLNKIFTIGIIVSSTIFGFLSISDIVNPELLFDFTVLAIIILSIINLGANLPDKINTHLNSIKNLTEFIVKLNNIIVIKNLSPARCEILVDDMEANYVSIVKLLPESSDKDWSHAKGQYDKKKNITESQ